MMNPFSCQFLNNNWLNQHLEFDFNKNSLNTTIQSQNSSVFPTKQNATSVSNSKNLIEQKQINTNDEKAIKQKKVQPINKKSRCFAEQIKKVLKKKFNNSSKQKKHQLWEKSYLNINAQISKVHFKISDETQRSTQNQQKYTNFRKDNSQKSLFNLNQFLQNNFNKQNKRSAIKKDNFSQNFKSPYFIGKNIKRNTHIKLSNEANLSNEKNQHSMIIDKLIQDQKEKQSSVFVTEEVHQKNRFQTFISVLQSLDGQILGKQGKSCKKPSRKLTFKEAKKYQVQKKNNDENLRLQRSLRRALSNVSSISKNKNKANEFVTSKQRLSVPLKDHNQISFNDQVTMQQFHYTKLKEKVNSKMEKYKKIQQARKNEQEQKFQMKSTKKIKQNYVQPNNDLIIQGKATAQSKYDKENGCLNKDFHKIKRPNTALSLTGLQVYQKQSYRKQSSNRENRLQNLTGINSSANHFRTFMRTVERQVEELNQCKSDRVVKNLRQKFSSRPKTARSNKNLQSSQFSFIKRPKTARNSQRLKVDFLGIEYEKVTRKQIEKQKIKQKLFEIMIDCKQEKNLNKNLLKGITVFEDFCQNVDSGLQNITKEINEYLKSD